MPVFYLDALSRYRADSLTSITQLSDYISGNLASQLTSQHHSDRWDALLEAHNQRIAKISEASKPLDDNTFGTGHLCQVLRKIVPQDSIFAIEAVTNTVFVADNIQPTLPGSWINCGGGGLGWSGGGALGIKLASEYENGTGKGKFVVQIVGDGTFLFSIPGSVYWISQRYKIPVLTIVLNNAGMFFPHTAYPQVTWCCSETDILQVGTLRKDHFSSSTQRVLDRRLQTKSSISHSRHRLIILVSQRQLPQVIFLRRKSYMQIGWRMY